MIVLTTTTRSLKRAGFLFGSALLLWLCPLALMANEGADGEEQEHGEHEEIVRLTQAEMEEFGVSTATAVAGSLNMEIVVPGEVAVNYDRLAHISPRFKGVVTKVNKHLGDEVRKGDVLAVIESNEGLVPYEVKSLLDGTVIEKHITVGEVLSEESSAFIIADLENVWVNLSIYQMYLPFVKLGQSVIVSAGEELPDARGTISYTSPIVDEHTRTSTARVVLENNSGVWRPGLFIEGRITIDKFSVALKVPKTAIQSFENRPTVFVKTEGGFVPRPVTTGRADSENLEILSGLNPGEIYADRGAFTLKAELEKSSLSEGHGH